MTMSPRDWHDMASVYQAGADEQRGYIMNVERQQQADALEAMARRCEELADQRNMTGDQLEEAQRAERQRWVVSGSRVKCTAIVQAGRNTGFCDLHKDHVKDKTGHALKPPPEPLRSLWSGEPI